MRWLAAMCVMGAVGCGTEAFQESRSIGFALEVPGGRCDRASAVEKVAHQVRERGFQFEGRRAAASVTNGSIAIDGVATTYRAPANAKVKAFRDGDRTAVTVISNGMLSVGFDGQMRELGSIDASHTHPDVGFGDQGIAVAFEDEEGARIGIYREGVWIVRSREHQFDPAIASLGSGRWVLAWIEGDVEHHSVRVQELDESGLPAGRSIDALPDLEVVRANITSSNGTVTIGALVATPNGVDHVKRTLDCL